MKLEEAVKAIVGLESEKSDLEEQLTERTQSLLKYGTAVFNAVRDMVPKGEREVQFQLGSKQYSIDSNGTLKQINTLPEADSNISIEVKD